MDRFTRISWGNNMTAATLAGPAKVAVTVLSEKALADSRQPAKNEESPLAGGLSENTKQETKLNNVIVSAPGEAGKCEQPAGVAACPTGLKFTDSDCLQAKRFLERLTGTDPETTQFYFQTFDDSPMRKGELAQVLHGTLPEVWPRLQSLQRRGAGAFVTINESVGGRNKEQVTRVRAVWRDVDTGTAPDLPLTEHMRVITPGGFHSYLLTSAGPGQFAEWDGVMETMVSAYGADKKAKDLSRVLRLPGTWHLKDPANPTKIYIESMTDAPPNSWAEITAAIPPRISHQAAGAKTVSASGNSTADQRSDQELVRQLVTGEDYHGTILTLTARYISRGMAKDKVVETIKGLMEASSDRSDRWKSRYQEIERLVAGAIKKFAGGKKHSEILVTLEAAKLAEFGPTEISEVVLNDMAASQTLRPSEVDDLLKCIKQATGISLKALREDLRARAAEGVEGLGETHSDYARQLLDTLINETGEHHPVGVEGRIYTLSPDGVWRGRMASEFEVEVGSRFSGQKNCQRRGDYLGIAAHAYSIAAQGREGFFDGAPVGLACADGFYRLEADGRCVLEPLNAEHRQRFILQASPSPMATPLFDKYLEQTFRHADPAVAAEQVSLLQEIAGAVAMGLMARLEKVALFYGPGRAGKGTALKLLECLVPSEFRAASSPFNWAQEYYLADLAGKRLNVVGELPEDQPIPAAAFKGVTGRDLLTGRHPSGRPFTFRNEAGHIFNTNYFMNTRDHSEAFFSRFMLIGFENSRLGMGEDAINADLAAQIIAEELPGVIQWALEGAQRLHARGHFTTTAVHERLAGTWRRRTDSALEFLHDEAECSRGEGRKARRAMLYERYAKWCGMAGRKALGKQRFYDALEAPSAAALGLSVKRDAKERELVLGLELVVACEGYAYGQSAEDFA